MSEPTTNGAPRRKQLSDQLDRLDSILDALADGLNQAVADAACDGTRLAVKDVLLEALASPELRELLAPRPARPTPAALDSPPGLWARLGGKAFAVVATVRAGGVWAATGAVSACREVREAVVALGRVAGEAVPPRGVALASLGVGVATAVACLLVPHETAAALAGVGAACAAAAAQLGWSRRRGDRRSSR